MRANPRWTGLSALGTMAAMASSHKNCQPCQRKHDASRSSPTRACRCSTLQVRWRPFASRSRSRVSRSRRRLRVCRGLDEGWEGQDGGRCRARHQERAQPRGGCRDTLVVPGAFEVEDVTRDRDLVRWVRQRAATCKRICSVCIGSFLLGAAGLLDGRRAGRIGSMHHFSPRGIRRYRSTPIRSSSATARSGLPPVSRRASISRWR